jgi:tRNA(adenine34) deaminase
MSANETTTADEGFMREALAEAALAEAKGEVPVGAVVVIDGEIVARAHNLRQTTQDPTAHAELVAVREAAMKLGSWRLLGASVYVTLEPCPMCAGMLVNSRVSRVVWGCDDPKAGATKTLYTIGSDPRLNHRYECVPGVLGEECAAILRGFFERLRKPRRGGGSSPSEGETPS